MKKCKVCKEVLIKDQNKPYSILEILYRWEKEANIIFREKTLQYYLNLKNKNFDLYKCPRCGFQIFLPAIIGTPDFYHDVSNQANNGYYVGHRWEFIQALNDLKNYNVKNVLDVGCGNGLFLDYVKKKRPDINRFGYDINTIMAQEASKKGHHVFSGEFDKIKISTQKIKFDSICLFQVLEHYANPINELRKITRKLSKHGILIICVPNSLGPVRHFVNALTNMPPHHITRWSEATFRYLLPQLGLKIDDVRYEPLPNNLWSSYLPMIIEKNPHYKLLKNINNKTKCIKALIIFLRMLRIPWLPGISGHTLYILATKY